MTNRVWAGKQILSIPEFAEWCEWAKDDIRGDSWRLSGRPVSHICSINNPMRAFRVCQEEIDAILALPEETATGAIPDNFVDKGGASPAEYLGMTRTVDEVRALIAKYEAMKKLVYEFGGVTDNMLGKPKPAICEEKPKNWWSRDNDLCGGSDDRIWYNPDAGTLNGTRNGQPWKLDLRARDANWPDPPNTYSPSTYHPASMAAGDPLPTWPKCHVCNKPVDSYKAESRLDSDAVTIRAKCHGKSWTFEVTSQAYSTGYDALILFKPGYDK